MDGSKKNWKSLISMFAIFVFDVNRYFKIYIDLAPSVAILNNRIEFNEETKSEMQSLRHSAHVLFVHPVFEMIVIKIVINCYIIETMLPNWLSAACDFFASNQEKAAIYYQKRCDSIGIPFLPSFAWLFYNIFIRFERKFGPIVWLLSKWCVMWRLKM